MSTYTTAETEDDLKFFRIIGDEPNVDELKKMLEGGNKSHFLNLINHSGMTGLHYAVMFDSQEALSLLLENGADPEVGVQGEGVPYCNMTVLEFSIGRRRRDCTAILKKHLGI